jgi:hypothetical protein
MPCRRCGAHDPDPSWFCRSCGSPLQQVHTSEVVSGPVVFDFRQRQVSQTIQSQPPFHGGKLLANLKRISLGVGSIVLFVLIIGYFLSRNSREGTNQPAPNVPIPAAESTPAVSAIPDIPAEPPFSGVVMPAYKLAMNPFKYKGKGIYLDVTARPVLLDGEVVQYIPFGNYAALGITGISFKKMLSGDTALYDLIGLDANSSDYESEFLGQIATIIPPDLEDPPDVGRLWKVEPMGTLGGTNAFGAPIAVPLVRFWRYADSAAEKGERSEQPR